MSVVAAPVANAAASDITANHVAGSFTGVNSGNSQATYSTVVASFTTFCQDKTTATSGVDSIVIPVGATFTTSVAAGANTVVNAAGVVTGSAIAFTALSGGAAGAGATPGTAAGTSISAGGRLRLFGGSAGAGAGAGNSTTAVFTFNAIAAGSASIIYAAGTDADVASTASNTLYITVVSACTSGTYSALYSDVSTTSSGTDSSWTANVDEQTAATAGDSLYIRVNGNNAYGANLTTGTYFATATNGALLNWGGTIGAAPIKGTASAATIASDSDGEVVLRVYPANDVVGGTTTVTITHNGTAVTSKVLTFFGEAAKISVDKVATGRTGTTNGAGTASGYILYTFKDAAGNTVPGSAAAFLNTSASTRIPTATSLKAPTISATTSGVASSGLAAAQETIIDATASGVMNYDCGSSSGTQSFTIYAVNDVTGATLTATVNAACYGSIATYAVSTDKATYKIGEVATITIEAKDSSGNPVSDNTVVPASTVSVGGGSLTAAIAGTEVFTAGKITFKAQLTTAGTFNTVVSIVGSTTTSATTGYTVTSSDVSNAEVLASIVKLIAAINKQIRALQKSLKR